ncbi:MULTISPECIES: type II secretion system minor pseudopilin GspJ [Alteromonadaceae]|uniref:type II secretion system minor pseudopilin GspJ n=1 Tax=Alteromonadaceae TaxID=72275 RepID=UPI001C0A38CB|nr:MULTISPECIES: type II secretion system minor pseudopilin GspJ [Aliiglaciecola]MBU2877526.1 type II secretion system minor pseudopilin GspJ [Aliiglaciecola lipolytica]MDO6711106.1 type II secretion system minor pseudopilin GspJ [Aliiglaciecola sp. 2_MG-2023]MDO6752020.1 type II secretion system minor pseudopilin GspJ [Aliiglaciecola sp. 1_MG-2023]
MIGQKQRGFTLIEIMIAVAIFTLIGIASTSVMTAVIDSDELSENRFEKLQTLQRAMLTIERDMLQAVPRAVRLDGEENTQVMHAEKNFLESEADGFAFVRAGWQNPQLMLQRSTLQSVGYRMQEGRLERLYGNYVDNVVGYEPKVRVLLTKVDDFQVHFLLNSGEDSADSQSWDDSYAQDTLPVAVKITITSQEFGVIERKFLMSSADS